MGERVARKGEQLTYLHEVWRYARAKARAGR